MTSKLCMFKLRFLILINHGERLDEVKRHSSVGFL